MAEACAFLLIELGGILAFAGGGHDRVADRVDMRRWRRWAGPSRTGAAKVVVDQGDLRIELDGFPEAGDGLVQLALARLRLAQTGMDPDQPRVELSRSVKKLSTSRNNLVRKWGSRDRGIS